MTDRSMVGRFFVVTLVLMVAMVGLGARLAFLHLGPHDELRESLTKARTLEKEIIGDRGCIFDCSGSRNLLAMNLPVKDVCADPAVLVKSERVNDVAIQLANSLEMPAADLAIKLDRPERRFAYVARFVKQDKADEIAAKDLSGVFFRDATLRYYPHGAFLCHVLGFVNHEGVGSSGIELGMDKYLRGSPGYIESKANALRQEMAWRRVNEIAPLEGASITLTIDQNVQYIVEKSLDELLEKFTVKGAWAIVQRVRTGEILAMANRPAFDLNEFNVSTESERMNRAIGYNYEPGSTFKVATFAAALDAGVVTPETVFDCENGAWLYKGRILKDYHPYGRLTVADGIKKSSNILTAKMALRLGEERLYQYLRAFGMGQKLGVDLPGEETGILAPPQKWSGVSITRIAMGQGVAVTALQMLSVLSAIANDGFVMRPYVISEVRRAEKVLSRTQPEVVGRPISAETAAVMRRLLARVTETGGTGTRAQIDGYTVAGKTGSAQKPVNGSYSMSAHMASFAGFVPAEDPEVAIIVVVDEPQPLHTGGVVAAPVFQRIASQAVRYLDVPPEGETIARNESSPTWQP